MAKTDVYVRVVDGDLNRLRLQPGDWLVLTIKEKIADELRRQLTKQLRAYFPDYHCLVVDGGAELSVLSRGDLSALPGFDPKRGQIIYHGPVDAQPGADAPRWVDPALSREVKACAQ